MQGDRLVGVDITDGTKQIILCSSGGKAIRFDENDVRPMGRTAAGVRGIRCRSLRGRGGAAAQEEVISLIIVDEQGMVLTASENGYGKRTTIEDFPIHGRGGQGVIALQISERNGRDGRRAAGAAGRRNHADQLRRHAGAHAGRRDLGARS